MRHREAGICFVADAAEIPAGLMKFQRQVNMFFSYGETGFILSSGRLCGRKDYKVSLISLSSTSLFTMA